MRAVQQRVGVLMSSLTDLLIEGYLPASVFLYEKCTVNGKVEQSKKLPTFWSAGDSAKANLRGVAFAISPASSLKRGGLQLCTHSIEICPS